MKKTVLAIIPILTVFGFAFIQEGCKKIPSPEEIKASIELVDVETKWVKKEYFPWPPKLILAPAISFRIKNLSEKPLRYVNIFANFRLRNESENLGDRFFPVFQNKPLMPEELSDIFLMACNFGFEGKNVADFKNNPAWKIADVKLFIRTKGSQPFLLGKWEVSRKIDFIEPEPYPPKKKEKKSLSSKKSLS